ncbi:crossover junction endodeoxyribonuclease RuvC [Pseudomonas sp. PNPG3]|uniref:crossover junction endodeoxyribonuclease RuvC n=1 Tax=Pseudomonas sp. PNPG3 TaxID=2919497 RepID=UPI001FFD1F50|nr:crossover junction endodeoxyribonuclease RuvC [Pseudomonas sp. PNPG3]MCK2123897.1 crossover junction endodeoxyribonuclease RuvC [Pseudomonas sp. PNPG3]
MRKILGIDPGLSGGLSIIDEQFNLIACIQMPTVSFDGKKRRVDPRPVFDFISLHSPELAVVELVGARPGQGVTSMFSFGDAFGAVRAIAECLCPVVRYSRPQEWRGFQALSGLSKEQIAEVAYEVFRAEQIYGKARAGKRAVRDGISDSLMLAKFGVRFLE